MNMTYRSIWTMAGTAALGLVLVALPGASQSTKEPDDSPAATLNRSYRDLERLHAALRHSQELSARAQQLAQEPGGWVVDDQDNEVFVLNDLLTDMEEGSGWLGVETRDVNAEKAKELKLPGERGVLLTGIVPDSPAAKAGLKENDVITEINGQRVEGAFQFRRMIHEIPAGRAVQLGIVRDGRPQSISVTLGKAEDRAKTFTVWKGSPSRNFTFRIPEIPRIDIEPFSLNGGVWMLGNRPRLGIDGEDLGGQLGAYFGAPDGEGILVREVQSGSAAEKAGMKAGDVLIKFNGERLRTVGDLREKLSAIREQKTVKLGVLRNRSELSLEATITLPEKPKARKLVHGTDI
jgi:C-terminal processing protease CtpA/Prc